MRPIANFTLHAALATALIAFAATGAAADDKSSAWIRVQQVHTGGSMAGPPGSTLGWIEIQGWDWESPGGTRFKGEITTIEPAPATAVDKWKPTKPHAREGAAKVEGFTVKQGVKPVQPKPRFVTFFDPSNPGTSVKPVGTSDLTMKRGTSPAAPLPAKPAPPSGDWSYDYGDTGTHEAPGAARPVTVGGSQAPAPSHADKFGRVRVKFAWDACAEGARLPSIELRDARTHHVLDNVTVIRCAPDGTTFAYADSRQSPAR